MLSILYWYKKCTWSFISGNSYLNIALNKNATQVSTRLNNFTYFGAMNANDGKIKQFVPYGDCMHTNDTDPDKWWMVDFGNMYTIESVSIFGRKFCCCEFIFI